MTESFALLPEVPEPTEAVETPTTRRVSRLRVVGLVIAFALLGASAAALVVGSNDRSDAQRDQRHARQLLSEQRARTTHASDVLTNTLERSQLTSQSAATALSAARNLSHLDGEALAAALEAQNAGLAGAVDAYNNAAFRVDVLVAQYDDDIGGFIKEITSLVGAARPPAPAPTATSASA